MTPEETKAKPKIYRHIKSGGRYTLICPDAIPTTSKPQFPFFAQHEATIEATGEVCLIFQIVEGGFFYILPQSSESGLKYDTLYTAYQSRVDNRIWLRPRDEFEDGRFMLEGVAVAK